MRERSRPSPVSLRAGMIATTSVGKEYGARTLFADVSLQLNAGSRYGLVGANGSGKSTFMRLLAGDEEASEGTVALVKRARVGVLRQDRFLDDGTRRKLINLKKILQHEAGVEVVDERFTRAVERVKP